MTPDERAARFSRDQYGLLSTRQSARAGLSPKQVHDRVRDKGWRRPARGLLLLPGAPPRSWRQDAMAGCLLGGDDARASHMTCAALHELCVPPLLPHVAVPPSHSVRTKLVRIHRCVIPVVDRAVIDGIRCTTASRSIVDSAALVDLAGVEAMIDEALCGGRASIASIEAALARAGGHHQGRSRVERGLAAWREDIRPDSHAEMRLLRRFEEWGIFGAVTQYEIYDESGLFVARVDVAFPERKHAFEYDSDRFHNPRRFDADERRHRALRRLGWRVDHISKLDLLPSAIRPRDLLVGRARSA